MAASISVEELLNLYDLYWFTTNVMSAENPHEVHGETGEKAPSSPSPSSSYILARSLSEQGLSSTADMFSSKGGLSPVSVLLSTSEQLETVFPGRDYGDFAVTRNEEDKQRIKSRQGPSAKRRYRRQKSKSLSELEFEELKGFMDLGFVFTEEDKDSNLVAIIPGLQRLGKFQGTDNGYDHNEEDGEEKCVVSRPYLSEAWEMLEEKEEDPPLLQWKIPSDLVSNETDMKNHLKFWAHTVAATVR